MFLEPKEVVLQTEQGEKTYILGKFTALAGREIISQYPLGAIASLKEYTTSEAVMLKAMCFVGIARTDKDGKALEPLALSSRALVDNHVPDWETLVKLEMLLLEYNCSFFRNGRAWDSLQTLGAKALPKIIGMLMPLLDKLSQADKQPTKS